MGYLDNSTIVVDAVLTKEGRKRLAAGSGLGIQYFTLSDSGIDYRLWNPDHPSGSAFYGEAIENLPSLEAIPRAEFYMRNKLITLSQDITGMPYWNFNAPDPIVINNETDVITDDDRGVTTFWEFKQQMPGKCLLIVENQLAITSVEGRESTCTVDSVADVNGLTYNALVNIESNNASYWEINPLDTSGTIRLNWTRPTNQDITTHATVIELNSGIYKTFEVQVASQ